MAHYPYPIIAREGWPHIAIAVVISFGATLVDWLWAIPFWVITLLVLQFFRDPPRELPSNNNAILAPADGKIVAVEKIRDPYLEREAIKISVFMNVFNVHSNRSPVDGIVREKWYFPGKFINAGLPKASLENERNAVWIRAGNGADVTCVQVAGFVAKRIICHVLPGDHLERGQRFGFIRFGSRVDVYLPLNTQINVNIGDKVSATLTPLAEFRDEYRITD